jgi:hypothetical protein
MYSQYLFKGSIKIQLGKM